MAFAPAPKPAHSFGQIQKDFVYNLRDLSKINTQFTIVEDLPASKPLRQKAKISKAQNTYFVDVFRISSNGFEADLELMDFETAALAILCPKDTKNFKGSTFAHDGMKWIYVCGDMPAIGTPQPTYQAPQQEDQGELFLKAVVNSIKAVNAIGTDVTAADMIKIADKITPGKALETIAMAKTKGYIIESNGIFKAV